MTTLRWMCALLVAAGSVGCDDGGSTGEMDAGPGMGPMSDAGPGLVLMDAGPVSGTDAGPPAPGTDAGPPAPGTDSGTPPAGGGTLTGVVTRSAEPAAGGVGDLFIGVFTSDPVTDRMGAMNVGQVLIEDVDMSASGASVPYTITGVPPRGEPYYVTAFLDDNGTATLDDPGPDRGDLVALDGFSSPQVTVDSATTVTFDIVLSFNLPF